MVEVKKLSAQQKLMIKRRKWTDLGFKKEEYEKFEQDVFNNYLSRDIADNLQETKDTLMKIEKSSREARLYFLCTFILAIFSIILVISDFNFVSPF